MPKETAPVESAAPIPAAPVVPAICAGCVFYHRELDTCRLGLLDLHRRDRPDVELTECRLFEAIEQPVTEDTAPVE